MPNGASAVTTAPVDFNGDGVADTFRVYRVGAVWHARAAISNVAVSDVVLSGPGPSMTAIGGATVNNDLRQEAWIKVGYRHRELFRFPSVRSSADPVE